MKVIILVNDLNLRKKIIECTTSLTKIVNVVAVTNLKEAEQELADATFPLLVSELSFGNKEMVLIDRIKRINPQMKVILYISLSILNQRTEVAFRGWDLSERVVFKELGFECLADVIKGEVEKIGQFNRQRDTLTIPSQTGITLVKYSDLIFIEKVHRQLIFHTAKRQIETYGTLKELEDQLPAFFFRSHRSYIINLQKIKMLVPQGRSFLILFSEVAEQAILSYDRQKELVKHFLL